MTFGPQPPRAPVRPHTFEMHGQVWSDDYRWLRERSDPQVLEYLRAENAYTELMMQHTRALQERLYAEMRGGIKETDISAPEKRGDYYYYTRTEEGRQYPIYCRKRGAWDAPEQILLDQNGLAAGHSFCHLGVFEVSPNHRLLAYSYDTTGAERFTLRVKDLDTGELLPDCLSNTYYSVEWANDNRTLFYNVLDHASRPYRLQRHTLGTDPAQDMLVHLEPDERYYLWLSKTRDRAYFLMHLKSTGTSEVWFAPADRPDVEFTVIQPRQQEVEYWVAHHRGRFLIRTNDQAENFRLVEAPVDRPSKPNWREVIPHRSDVLLDGLDAFRNHVVLYERVGGLKQMRILSPELQEVNRVAFPEPVYTFEPGPNEEFETTDVRFTYSSLVTPDSVIDYDMRTGAWAVKKQKEIPSGYDPAEYHSERITATTPDGAQVPVSLVYKKGLVRDGRNPCLLHGYGAYGACVEPEFDAVRLSLLDRGFVYAIAHVRGGSYLGRGWYDQGRLLNKRNSFNDFIACAEHLIAQGYTSNDRLAIIGVSAGGLLVGAVTMMRPELFKAVVAKVPFVDVINTMNDHTIPLTVIELEQWGDPADKTYFEYMKSYSPYDNVTPKDYPNVLITAGLNDPRVAYWEPAKWAARLRATKTDGNRLLLKTNMDAGHAGSSGRYDRLKEIAFEYAFVLDMLGIHG